MGRAIVLFVLFVSLFPGLSLARSWHVEKDGSGDYSIIQQAVDVAASGDTILVGPGWFEEYRIYPFSNGDFAVYVNNLIPDLTIIGAGSEETFIGSSVEDAWGDSDLCVGVLCASAYGIPHELLRLENLTISGVPRGVEITSGSIILDGCVMSYCYRGVSSLRPAQVNNCEFNNVYKGVSTNYGASDLIVENCFFNDCNVGLNCGSTPNMSIRNCQFLGIGDVATINGCSGEMWGCSAPDAWYSGVYFAGTGEFHIYDNELNCAHFCLTVENGDNLLCEGNVFSGTDRNCIKINGGSPTFRNNQILKDSGFAVSLAGYGQITPIHVDMTKNYWGTADPDSISAWISDANDDDPVVRLGYVDFLPFIPDIVPTEKTTMGSLRAMFRGETK